MNQNFYIPDEKKELLERIQELSDKDSLSATIVEALEEYVDTKRTLEEDMEKHTLDIPVFDGETVIGKRKIRFIGCFLKEAEILFDSTKLTLRIYQGKKGRFLLYWLSVGGVHNKGGYQTFDSLEETENYVDIDGFPEEAEDSLRELAQEAEVTLRENKADVEIVDI